MNPFIDIPDRDTGRLDLGDVSIESQYAKLTREEKELVFLKIHGYTAKPPTIEQLYTDPYYLGGPEFFNNGEVVFPYWKKILAEIYPDRLQSRYVYLNLSGAIGIGKSAVSRMMMAMTYARLSCMASPHRTFGLAPKPLSFVLSHRVEDTANIEFKKWMQDVLKKSPFFQNLPNQHNIKIMTAGPQSGAGLGSDVIFYIMSELAFWPNQEKAIDRLHTNLLRLKSRFSQDNLRLAGQFIIDSSAHNEDDAQHVFLEESDPTQRLTVSPAHFEVRPGLYKQSGGKTFNIYKGDGQYAPMILGDTIPTDLDPDRVIKVPIQCMGDAKADLHKFLQDVCGVSTSSTDLFFNSDISHVVACSKGRNVIPETFDVDFYDQSDRVWDRVEPQLRTIPRNQFLSVGLDLAISSDTAAISISGFDSWKDINRTKVPLFKCYALFGLTRREGQETSLFHIEQFIEDLNKRYRVMVCADQAYSKSIFQYCQRLGIQTRYFSTDRTTELGTYLKNVINREQIELPYTDRLCREAHDLRTVKRGQHMVIDHPSQNASPVYDNTSGTKKPSKDFWDALSQSIYGLNINITEGQEYGVASSYVKQMDIINNMTKSSLKSSSEIFQGMLESIW